ncbi:MAG: glycerophosphodiester phosphodiesterase [Hyalangium sp.]|uniref:glycerophosphodiester phosphodiesterase n=1 Tax=Hyalangium sp. TaxID=2028555 RepID=UPI00389B0476
MRPNKEPCLSLHSTLRRSLRTLRFSAAIPLAAACALALTGCSDDDKQVVDDPTVSLLPKQLVVGHRGAPAWRPEHTIASYTKAIADGADIIEPDVVSTKDGYLVARHENDITGTTNVSTVTKYADRKTTKTVDGVQITGWFTEDFTLAELKELRARERIPQVRPDNTQYNDQFEIPTLTEIIALAEQKSAETGRTIYIFPETKHPTYFQSIGLPLEDRLINELKAHDFTATKTKVFIQSFELANLKYIRSKIGTSQPNWVLVQLLDDAAKQPYDFVAAGDKRTYGDLTTAESLKDIATYADSIGPYKMHLISVDGSGNLMPASDVVRNAHLNKMLVIPWTFRPENTFLPASLKSTGTDNTRNPEGSVTEIQSYLKAGIDGFFTDDPAIGRQAVDTFQR